MKLYYSALSYHHPCRYEGEWKNDRKHGRGVQSRNGRIYDSVWGDGVEYTPEKQKYTPSTTILASTEN